VSPPVFEERPRFAPTWLYVGALPVVVIVAIGKPAASQPS
jgi:hypothetical protein